MGNKSKKAKTVFESYKEIRKETSCLPQVFKNKKRYSRTSKHKNSFE